MVVVLVTGDLAENKDSFPLRRPAIYLFLAAFLPILLVVKIQSKTCCLLLSMVLLFTACFFRPLKKIKTILICLFIFQIARMTIYWQTNREVLSEDIPHTFTILNFLWQNEEIDRFCARARTDDGKIVALILPFKHHASKVLSCRVQELAIARATNPGGFDEDEWLFGKGIFKKYESCGPILELKSRGICYQVRYKYLLRVYSFVEAADSELAAFLLALLFGEKKYLSKTLKSQFQSLNLAHILAVSGMHLSFLIRAFQQSGLRKILGYKASHMMLALIICFWSFLCSFPASFLRAALLYLARKICLWKKYRIDSVNNLAFAFTLSLVVNPFLLFDKGAIWSYAAAASIFFFGDDLKVFFSRLGVDSKKLRDNLASTCSAQFAILFLNASNRGQINFVYILFQLLFCFICSIIFRLSLPLLLLISLLPIGAFSFLRLGKYFLRPLYIILSFCVEGLCRVSMPAFLRIENNVYFLGICAFIALAYLLIKEIPGLKGKFYRRKKFFTLILIIIFLVSQLWPVISPLVEIYFLDVGQGDALVIRNKGKAILIDGGTKDKADQVIFPFMQAKGIQSFTSIILTHADIDHIGAAHEVIRQNKAKAVYIPEYFTYEQKAGEGEFSSEGRKLLDSCRENDIPVYYFSGGDYIYLKQGEIFLKNLEICRIPKDKLENNNDTSLVLLFSCYETQLLLTGDMTEQQEKQFVNEGNLSGNRYESPILKVAHHGSGKTTGEQFLKIIKPEVAIISVGKNNPYRHPHTALLKRLFKNKVGVLRTDLDGAIKICISPKEKIAIYTYKTKNYYLR